MSLGKEKEQGFDWPKPTIDEAIDASQQIGLHYGASFSKIDVGEPIEPQRLNDRETAQKLLNLADNIMDGIVDSHVKIAKVIRSLGSRIGSLGSTSTEIDLAAFRVSHAILQKQKTFQKT